MAGVRLGSMLNLVDSKSIVLRNPKTSKLGKTRASSVPGASSVSVAVGGGSSLAVAGGLSVGSSGHKEVEQQQVQELEDFPENWRRSKLAWLCKELGVHKTPTLFRLLNSQKKWMRQPDATFVALHFLRIRLYHPAFQGISWGFVAGVPMDVPATLVSV